LAPRAGFEPATLSLEVSCSIQLSYQGASACDSNFTELPTKQVCSALLAKLLSRLLLKIANPLAILDRCKHRLSLVRVEGIEPSS
jgi:hypothetical protein